MALIKLPWDKQPPADVLLDPDNDLARGIVAGAVGNRSVYIGAKVPWSFQAGGAYKTTAGGEMTRASGLQQIATQITTSSDITLFVVGEVSTSSAANTVIFGLSHNGATNTFVIETSDASTAGKVIGKVYLGAYRTIGGSQTLATGTVFTAALRHRHNTDQVLWVNGTKDSSTGSWTGSTVGNQYWGSYSGTSNHSYGALGLAWNRALSDSEIERLFDNPWGVFEPRKIWIPSTAGGGSFKPAWVGARSRVIGGGM